MIPYSYNMVNMDGIDLAEANCTVVDGIYNRIIEAVNACGDAIFYNWKFAGIDIAPSAVNTLEVSDNILINGLIQVTELDEVTVLGIEPPPPPIEPVSPLEVTENGVYEAEPPASGFNPVTVTIPPPNIVPVTITENGVYEVTPPVSGFSPVTVDVETGGGIIFASDVVSLEYIGALTTFTFANSGYYAVLGAIDGSSSSSISFSVNGATVIESDNKTSVSTVWGSAATGILLSANIGDNITITGTNIARQVMVVIRIPGATSLSSLDLAVAKDSPLSKTVQNVSGGYSFFMAGSTGGNGVTVNVTSDNELKWSGQATNPITLHKYGAFEGESAISCSVQGSSYATNYVMLFEAE